MLIYVGKVRFWDPLQNPMAPKCHPKSPGSRKKSINSEFRARFGFLLFLKAPETPPEAPLVTCFMIFEGFWHLSGLISKDRPGAGHFSKSSSDAPSRPICYPLDPFVTPLSPPRTPLLPPSAPPGPLCTCREQA
jgi:hypothetical protein